MGSFREITLFSCNYVTYNQNPSYRLKRAFDGRAWSLHKSRLCRHALNVPHVPMVYRGHLTIIPRDRDGIPTQIGDTAAVSGIASPINAVALLEAFGFGRSHRSLLVASFYRHAKIEEQRYQAIIYLA